MTTNTIQGSSEATVSLNSDSSASTKDSAAETKIAKRILTNLSSASSYLWKGVCWLATPVTFLISKIVALFNYLFGKEKAEASSDQATHQAASQFEVSFEGLPKIDNDNHIEQREQNIQQFFDESENILTLKAEYHYEGTKLVLINNMITDLITTLAKIDLQRFVVSYLEKQHPQLKDKAAIALLLTDTKESLALQSHDASMIEQEIESEKETSLTKDTNINALRKEVQSIFISLVNTIVDHLATKVISENSVALNAQTEKSEWEKIVKTLKSACYAKMEINLDQE